MASRARVGHPKDLSDFWCETGGGGLFESETILGPFGPAELGDDVDSVNQYEWRQGMSRDWLVFHTGIGVSILEMSSGRYSNVQPDSYRVERRFSFLNDWYCYFIREEYAERYGLRR